MIKKTAIFGTAIVSIILIACATFGTNDNKNNTKNINSTIWKNKVPELFNNVGYSKLFESNIVNNKVSSGTNQDIGKVTNPFGIRDDVLEFIINYFPNNESAVYAAIRMEQDNTMIYKSKKERDIMQYANSPATWCLGNIIGAVNLSKYVDNIDNLKLSTKEGKMVDNAIRKKLGWKIFGFGHRTNQQLDTICEKGNY